MAGEWIKVELATPDKPEVLRLARILKIDKDAVFGKLIRLWAWFDRVSVDGRVDGAVSSDVDAMCHHDGFAVAAKAVGWLDYDDEAEWLLLPKFDRHNGETAKQRGLKNERQARWRANKDAPVDKAPSTKASTREEKRREEEKQKNAAPVGAANDPDLFEGVDPQVVADFKALRKAKKSTITATAIAGIKREAEKAGLTLESALRICCERGWAGFSASWQGIPTATPPSQPGGGRRAL
jgi:hypothetical protein